MYRLVFLCLCPALLLTACQPYAPTVYIAGSFFPAWLICFVLGIIGTVLLRVLFIKSGLEDVMPAKLLVYVCLTLIIAMLIAYFGFAF